MVAKIKVDMTIYIMKFKNGGKPSFRIFDYKEAAQKEIIKAKPSIIKEELHEWFEVEQVILQQNKRA